MFTRDWQDGRGAQRVNEGRERRVCTHSSVCFPALHWPGPWASWAVRWLVLVHDYGQGDGKQSEYPCPRMRIVEYPETWQPWQEQGSFSAGPEHRRQNCGGIPGAHCALQRAAHGPRQALAGSSTLSCLRPGVRWGCWRGGEERGFCSGLGVSGLGAGRREPEERLARQGGCVQGARKLWTRPDTLGRCPRRPRCPSPTWHASRPPGPHLTQRIFTVFRATPTRRGGGQGSRRCGRAWVQPRAMAAQRAKAAVVAAPSPSSQKPSLVGSILVHESLPVVPSSKPGPLPPVLQLSQLSQLLHLLQLLAVVEPRVLGSTQREGRGSSPWQTLIGLATTGSRAPRAHHDAFSVPVGIAWPSPERGCNETLLLISLQRMNMRNLDTAKAPRILVLRQPRQRRRQGSRRTCSRCAVSSCQNTLDKQYCSVAR